MQYFISIMCIDNAQPIITLLLLCFNPLNSHELCIKELTVQDTSKRSCIRSSLLCGTNLAMRPTCRPKPYPPPPPPYLSPAPCQGYKRTRVRGGGAAAGHLLPPGPRPHSLTALTLHICQWPPVILQIMQNTPFNGAGRRPAPHPLLATFPSPKSNIFIYLFCPLCVEYVYVMFCKDM